MRAAKWHRTRKIWQKYSRAVGIVMAVTSDFAVVDLGQERLSLPIIGKLQIGDTAGLVLRRNLRDDGVDGPITYLLKAKRK